MFGDEDMHKLLNRATVRERLDPELNYSSQNLDSQAQDVGLGLDLLELLGWDFTERSEAG